MITFSNPPSFQSEKLLDLAVTEDKKASYRMDNTMGATMSALRVFFCLIASSILTGCAFSGSVFDPSPYTPNRTDSTRFQFNNLTESATKLQQLSDGYACQRDNLMRQQLLFDLPLMGVAAAAIASGIYGGSKDLILGFGTWICRYSGRTRVFRPARENHRLQ